MIRHSTKTNGTGLDGNATSWLTLGLNSPWNWDETGEAIQWGDGTTVVLAEELAAIVERFGDSPVPPLPGIAFLLLAIKGWALENVQPALRAKLHDLVKQCGDLLRNVPAKHLLISTLLEPTIRSDAPTGNAIAHVIRLGWRPSPEQISVASDDSYRAIVPSIAQALAKLTPEQIRLLLETGLQHLPEAEDHIPPLSGISSKAFLQALEEDQETAGVAQLTRDIMAALTLPQALPLRAEWAAGGVSDISNRGPLHRLLLSELAYDDDTLAARLAMNEALYLQPEPPGEAPPSRLVVLVDCGLRLWGLSRVFATSAALALQLKARGKSQVAAWRPAGEDWVACDFQSAEGLKEHLGILESAYDLTAALPKAGPLLGVFSGPCEVALCVHRATLHAPAFLPALEPLLALAARLHLVAVDAEGALTLHQYSSQGLKQVHEARLKLEKLTQKRPVPQATRARVAPEARTWPALYALKECPFAILPPSRPYATLCLGDAAQPDIFALNKRHEIWHRKQRDPQGFRRVPADRLRGVVLAFEEIAQPFPGVVACSWDMSEKALEVLVVGAQVRENTIFHWRVAGFENRPDAVWCDQGHLLVRERRTIRIIPLDDGVELPEFDLPEHVHPLAPYAAFFATYNPGTPAMLVQANMNGGALNLRKVGPPPNERLLAVFDFNRSGDFRFLFGDGSVEQIETKHRQRLLAPQHLVRAKVSPNGRRLWIQTDPPSGPYLLDLASGKRSPHAPDQSHVPFFVELDTESLHTWYGDMRTHVVALGITGSGGLLLEKKNGKTDLLVLVGNGFYLRPTQERSVLPVRKFGNAAWHTGQRCRVRSTEWLDGSRAFLDDRGLLHLQSVATEAPEISFRLTSRGPLCAWSSDGHQVSPIHTPTEAEAPHGEAIASHLKRFTLKVLR